ncbi:MAG: hydroxysqualene dehydroxylase HpnE [Phycisphaerales bacterium JB050]
MRRASVAGRVPGSATVIGAGLAGLAAALRLSELGCRVTVLETRQKLGGRATSFDDARSGMRIDNCQHVVLGCCTNYRGLLERLGLADALRWYRTTHWLEPGGRHSVTGPGPLPAPLHGATLLFSARFLPMKDRLAIGRAMLEAIREDRAALACKAFRTWLERQEQSEVAIRRFWEPLVVSACNLPVDRVDQQVALHVVQEGFLATRQSSAIGVPRVPLMDLYEPARERIEAAGGRVITGESAAEATADMVRTKSGAIHRSERVICAVPFERLRSVLGDEVVQEDPALSGLDELQHSPILGVHLTFDRPVLMHPHAVLVDRPTQWLFRKDEAGAVIHAVISAAANWMKMDEQMIVERVCEDIRACVPAARGAQLVSHRAVKEKRATFAPTPEARDLRPPTQTGCGVILAGCYVQTGWPSTMEGAVRSGEMAAAVACGLPRDRFVSPSLKPALLSALLARS